MDINDKIDNIFKEIGDFGPYQLFVVILCGSLGSIVAINSYSQIFFTHSPKYR